MFDDGITEQASPRCAKQASVANPEFVAAYTSLAKTLFADKDLDPAIRVQTLEGYLNGELTAEGVPAIRWESSPRGGASFHGSSWTGAVNNDAFANTHYGNFMDDEFEFYAAWVAARDSARRAGLHDRRVGGFARTAGQDGP